MFLQARIKSLGFVLSALEAFGVESHNLIHDHSDCSIERRLNRGKSRSRVISNATPVVVNSRNDGRHQGSRPPKDVHRNAHTGIIHNSHKLETSRRPIHRRTYEQMQDIYMVE